MIQEYTKLYTVLPFFENKPPSFQKSFCKVFGTNVQDKEQVFSYVKSFCELKWEKVNNGKVIKPKDIYLIRGESIVLSGSQYNFHHWAPSSRDSEADTIKIIAAFHKAWHALFMNLYKEAELYIYLNKIFSNKYIDNFAKAIDEAKEEAEQKFWEQTTGF